MSYFGFRRRLGAEGCSQATLATVQVLFTEMFPEWHLSDGHCSRLQGYSDEQNPRRCCPCKTFYRRHYLSSGFWQICSPGGSSFLGEGETRAARSPAEPFNGNSSSGNSWCGCAADFRVEDALRSGHKFFFYRGIPWYAYQISRI